MSGLFELAVMPQPVFIKLSPVDRNTIENWVRAGSLVPAKPNDHFKELSAKVWGSTYSLKNLLEVEMMKRFRAEFSIPPKRASELADAILAACQVDIENEFSRLSKEGAERDDGYVAMFGIDDEGRARRDFRQWDTFMLAVPIGALAYILHKKFTVFDAWAQVELPKIREAVVETLSERADDDS